jgi:membrane protease YdiL (CAAX protease family)
VSPFNALWVLTLAWFGAASAAAALRGSGWLSDVEAYLVFQAGMLAVLCLASLAVAGGAGLADALGLRRPRARHLAWAGLAFAVYLPLDLLLQLWPLWPAGDQAGPLEALRAYLAREATAAATPGLLLGVVVLAPLAEELGFRGLLQGSLARTPGGAWVPLAVPGALWTLGHLGGPTGSGWLSTLVLAGALALLRDRSGTVVPGIALHAALNAAWFGISAT